jgi:hypothetical protein
MYKIHKIKYYDIESREMLYEMDWYKINTYKITAEYYNDKDSTQHFLCTIINEWVGCQYYITIVLKNLYTYENIRISEIEQINKGHNDCVNFIENAFKKLFNTYKNPAIKKQYLESNIFFNKLKRELKKYSIYANGV